MSDQTLSDEAAETTEIDELALLKQRAKMMGITFSNNISVETLKKKIVDKMSGEETAPTDEADTAAAAAPSMTGEPARPRSLRQQIREDAMKLVRLRITNLDPKKKDLPGEIISIYNSYLGTVRKFVPFGAATDNGYHVPYCIYTFLKERQFLSIKVRKGSNREPIIERRMVPEFALEVLPPLTPAELRKLAAAQAAAGGVE